MVDAVIPIGVNVKIDSINHKVEIIEDFLN